MFARSGRQAGEKKSGAAVFAGPDDIGMTVQREIGSGQLAAECEIGTDGNGLAGLQRESVFSDVDGDGGQSGVHQLQIDQSLEFVALGAAKVRLLSWLFRGELVRRERGFDLFAFERTVEDAARARLECAAGP